MGLDVTPPDPPVIDADQRVDETHDATVAGDADLRREELQTFLESGAWERGFNEWAAHADVDDVEWRIVEDLDLIAEFDFFWDDFAGRVGYSAPGIGEDWQERDLHPELSSWGRVSGINAGLTELGRAVADLLTDEYVDWDEEYEAPDDVPDF